MELNITEYDNVNTINNYDHENPINYWEKSIKTESKEKRKKVSFNDILSNMNLVVNNQGVLQFMVPKQEDNSQQNQYNPNNFYQSTQYQTPNFNPRQQNIRQREEPLEPSIKHSSIYNKYFKDYIDPNMPKLVPKRVPKTLQEYHRMLLEYKIKAIEDKKRIEQIKSTKLMFTSSPESGSNPRNVVASNNNLRRLNFH